MPKTSVSSKHTPLLASSSDHEARPIPAFSPETKTMMEQALYGRRELGSVVGMLFGFVKQNITQARVQLLGLMGNKHDPLSTVINDHYLDANNARLVKNLNLTPVFFKNADKVARLQPEAWSDMFPHLTKLITDNKGYLGAANTHLNTKMEELGITSYTLDEIKQEVENRKFRTANQMSSSSGYTRG